MGVRAGVGVGHRLFLNTLSLWAVQCHLECVWLRVWRCLLGVCRLLLAAASSECCFSFTGVGTENNVYTYGGGTGNEDDT